MKPEEQRVAIAEACGWRMECDVPNDRYGTVNCLVSPSGVKTGQFTDAIRSLADAAGWNKLPDYLGDLNAMHEAEKALNEEQFEQYAFWLAHVTPLGKQLVATAAQRAEAFLHTLGLWAE